MTCLLTMIRTVIDDFLSLSRPTLIQSLGYPDLHRVRFTAPAAL